MSLLDWRILLFSRPSHPNIKEVQEIRDDSLYFDSLTRGLLISGNPGTGKTTWLAMILVSYAIEYPDRPIIVLDASGSLTNEFIEIYHSLPRNQYMAIDGRFIPDFPGDTEDVITKPLFSDQYGLTDEELVAKSTEILEELNREKIELNPSMAAQSQKLPPRFSEFFWRLKMNMGDHGK